MFVYTDKKICIAAPHRCGSTSMYSYFGLPRYKKLGKAKFNFAYWNSLNNESITKVLVLRNPYQRIESAIYNTEYLSKDSKYSKLLDFDNQERKLLWTIKHSEPYLHNITCEDFYIIDFDHLSMYIDKCDFTVTTNSKMYQWQDKFAMYHSKEDLASEYKLFEKYSQRHNLLPSAWKDLT